jgi:P27 family predicted phage terminase small subunit
VFDILSQVPTLGADVSGPAKTPTAILKARGSWRAKSKDRQGEPEVASLEGVPVCPEHLHGSARGIWDTTAAVLVGIRVLTNADLDTLADYCATRAEYLKLDDQVRRKLSVLSKAKFFPVVVAMRNNAREATAKLASQLGLSPAARARVKAVSPEPKDEGKSRFFKGA